MSTPSITGKPGLRGNYQDAQSFWKAQEVREGVLMAVSLVLVALIPQIPRNTRDYCKQQACWAWNEPLRFVSGPHPFSEDTESWESPPKRHTWVKATALGASLLVQWLRLRASNAGGPGSIPAQGTRSHMLQLRARMPQLKILYAATKILHAATKISCATTKNQSSQINK